MVHLHEVVTVFVAPEDAHSLVQELSATWQEGFCSGYVPVTLCSALPNFHHTWLSFQTHVALRHLSQQVGSYFAHQDPHHDVRACDRGHQLFRDHQGLLHLTQTDLFVIEVLLGEATAVSVWPSLGMEVCQAQDFIQQLLPCGSLLLGCSAHTWEIFCSPTVSGTSTWRFAMDAKVVNWSVLLFSLNPSISTPGRTAGHPCVVPMELACSFYKNVCVCVLLNLSECGRQ